MNAGTAVKTQDAESSPASLTPSSATEGCVFSFTDSGIPLYTSGYTVLPNSGSGPPTTVPCNKFLPWAYRYAETANREATTSDNVLSASPPSLETASNHTGSRTTGVEGTPSIISSVTKVPGLSTTLTTDSNIFNTTVARPTFLAPDLTGCYAGTGGFTVITASPGDYLPAGYVPGGTTKFYHNTDGGAIDYPQPTATIALSMNCTDFMTMPFYHAEDATKFKQDPVCTSYLEWDQQHKGAPHGIGYSPPGVYDYWGVDHIECCGGCALVHPDISIHYFSTAPAPVCSNDGGTITTPPKSEQTAHALDFLAQSPQSAILDGTTLTFPSIYLSANGVVFARDECGIVGKKHTNPIIAVRPGGLSTLSFSKFFDIAYGATTGLFDPALPKSCWTYGAGDPIISSFMRPNSSNPKFSTLTTATIYTEGYPHWPFLRPPDEMFELDPVWKKSCRYWHTAGNQHYAPSFGIFDPPRMLTPVASMGSPSSTPTIMTTQSAAWITPVASASPGAFGSAGTPTSTLPVRSTPPATQSTRDGFEGASTASIDHQPGLKATNGFTDASMDHQPGLKATNGFTDTSSILNQQYGSASTIVGAGGSRYEIMSDAIYTVDGQILSAGGPPVVIDDISYSLDHSAAVLLSGTKSIPLSKPSSTSPFTHNYEGIFPVKSSGLGNVAQTSPPSNPPIVVNSISDSLQPEASVLISSGNPVSVESLQRDHPILNIGGHAYTADDRPRVQFRSTAIFAGAPPVTIDGFRYSLAPSAAALIVGSNTISMGDNAIATNAPEEAANRGEARLTSPSGNLADIPVVIGSSTKVLHAPALNYPPVITINSTPYTANEVSAFVVGTRTLAPGSSAITVNSTRYSLPSLPTITMSSSSAIAQGEAVITVASHVYTCRQNSPCTIASQVLTPNGSITVGADAVVYGEGGIDVVRESISLVTPSREEVKTSHISGLTPIGEETGTAPAAETGKAKSVGSRGKMGMGKEWMLLSVAAAVIVGWYFE